MKEISGRVPPRPLTWVVFETFKLTATKSKTMGDVNDFWPKIFSLTLVAGEPTEVEGGVIGQVEVLGVTGLVVVGGVVVLVLGVKTHFVEQTGEGGAVGIVVFGAGEGESVGGDGLALMRGRSAV